MSSDSSSDSIADGAGRTPPVKSEAPTTKSEVLTVGAPTAKCEASTTSRPVPGTGHTLESAAESLLTRAPAFGKMEGWLTLSEGAVLFALASALETTKGHVIIEVGSYRGKSTTVLALGSPQDARVYAFDPHEMHVGSNGGVYGPIDRLHFNRTMEATLSFAKVYPMSCGTDLVADAWKRPVGLCFIDGDHTYEGAQKDAVGWHPHVVSGGWMAFDDINLDGPGRVFKSLSEMDDYDVVAIVGKVGVLRKR